MNNAVVFVSLGPGDPELITVKGLKALQQADLIFCPATAGSSRAMDILMDLNIQENKIETFQIPMSKDRSLALRAYQEVSIRIANAFRRGLHIAITAEGDAGFYSSIHYIYENLCAENISTTKIAGVPAFIACGALANLHVVKQDDELIVMPGTLRQDSLQRHMNGKNTMVIMKPSQCEQEIKAMLDEENLVFHYFENAGLPEKEFYTQNKDEIKRQSFPYFSLLIIQKTN